MRARGFLVVITAFSAIGCSGITDVPRNGNTPTQEGPTPIPINPAFNAKVYGSQWSAHTISVTRDVDGTVVITGIGATAWTPMTLTLLLATATSTGTYSLSAYGNGSSLTISGTNLSPYLTWSSLYSGGGTATVVTSSPTRITGKFSGTADSAGGSGESLDFVGEFDVSL